MSKIIKSILEGKDIRSAIKEASEEDTDLSTEGKELAEFLTKETGYSFDYDFEFGEIVCFCVDNIPATVNIIKRPDEKYDLYIGDDVVSTKDSAKEIAEVAQEKIENLEVE